MTDREPSEIPGDTYFDSLHQALEEVRRRRQSGEYAGWVTNMERSPYGGWRVKSLPADVVADMFVDGVLLRFPPRERRYYG